MTLQTACGSLGFSIGVRFAWTFTYSFTLADGPAWLRMTIYFFHCDENLRMMGFFSRARVLSMADGLRFNSLGQSLYIIQRNKNHNNASFFCGPTFPLSIMCEVIYDVQSGAYLTLAIDRWRLARCILGGWKGHHATEAESSLSVLNRTINLITCAKRRIYVHSIFVFFSGFVRNEMQTACRTRDKFTRSPKIKYILIWNTNKPINT